MQLRNSAHYFSLTPDAPHPDYIVVVYLPNSGDDIPPPSALGEKDSA